MQTDALPLTTSQTAASLTQPYPPSWVDRILHWIGNLPIPAWVFYPLLLALEFLAVTVLTWLTGYKPFGAFEGFSSQVIVYNVAILGSIQLINHIATRAFESFRPALGLDEAEESRLKYKLTVMPPRPVWIWTAGGALFALIAEFSDTSWGVGIPTALFILINLVGIISFALSGVAIYHTIWQLRMVSLIHTRATRIDLFQAAPLYAFSALTALTGAAFILSVYFNIVFDPATLTSAPLLALNGLSLVLAALCFILPLYGMHQRIAAEKGRLLNEANQRLETTRGKLYQSVDTQDLREADGLNKTLASLVSMRELIAKLPTWPWHPNLATGFITALLLPIIVWLITRVLSRFGF